MDHRVEGKRRSRSTSPSMEQYVETIASLLQRDKVTTISEIAETAGVSRPAASRSVRDLAEKELVEHKSYGYVTLTPKGQDLAEHLFTRHRALLTFFRQILQLDEEIADREACRLEHQVDDNIVDRMTLLTAFFESRPDAAGEWFNMLDASKR